MFTVWNKPDLPMGLVVSIGLVAGGGMGNMVDRLMEGYVTDFIATRFIDFPVFNVADMCVTVGVFATVIGYWVWDSRRERDDGNKGSHGGILDTDA
jgi:signal peptidase II